MTAQSNGDAAENADVLRSKWLMDGAETLTEAAERLEAEAARLRGLHAQGWRLEGPIEDDYGTLIAP